MRQTFVTDGAGKVPQLDLYSTVEGQLASITPFSLGYNKPVLDVFGEPVKDFPWAATTKRFGVVDFRDRDPVLETLVAAKLFIPKPSKVTTVLVAGQDGEPPRNRPVGQSQDVWEAFQRYRGEYLRNKLTPDVAENLSKMAEQSVDSAQSFLSDELGTSATEYAKIQVGKALSSGKLKFE